MRLPCASPAGWHCRCTASAMSLRVLLVGSDCDLVAAVELSLSRLADMEVVRAPDDAALVEAVAAAAPDVVIVDMSRSDPDRLDAIRQVAQDQPRPIVMFVDADDPLLMEAAIAAGVSSYNVVGATLPDVQPIVRAAIALFRRYRRIEEELAAARASLAESSVIDKAKARLIRHRNLSEPAAYRLLRRRAMDEGRRIADIAREILATGE
jgi:two-component system, response regulator / RNA-binding antiterminator